MTSKLKCPVCQQDLGIILCDTDDFICSKCRMCGSEKLWRTLIQAKQDLENAKADIEDYKKYKALWEEIRNNTILELEHKLETARKALKEVIEKAKVVVRGYEYIGTGIQRVARKALEQIEHKE